MSEKFYLTPVEHELMEILWALGQGTVREVIACLPSDRHLAYTSVSTILRILQQKKILTVKKSGRHHVYIPILSKATFATHSLKKIVNLAFSGNSASLVAHLVEKHPLSLDELKVIRQLLEEKQKEFGS